MIRALHHTKIAMEYFEDVSKQLSGTPKNVTNGFASKCKWIIQEVRHRMPPEHLKRLDYELKDSLFLESIETEIIKFNDEQRNILENIVNLIAKGEKIQIIDDGKSQ
jgi:hypothetical protein